MKSPVSGGVRNPDHCTPNVFLPATSAGRLLSVSLTLASVRLTMGEMPAPMVFDMTLMEYMTHGWDLATATGQAVPFTDTEAEDVLGRARATLKPEYRGPDSAMGEEAEAPPGAPAVVQLAAFMGRRVS